MKLTIVKRNNKNYRFVCGFQPKSNSSTVQNKIFHTMDQLLEFALDQQNDWYIISISDEIYDYVKKINHEILRRKNFQFV
jgi:hypothetical protein